MEHSEADRFWPSAGPKTISVPKGLIRRAWCKKCFESTDNAESPPDGLPVSITSQSIVVSTPWVIGFRTSSASKHLEKYPDKISNSLFCGIKDHWDDVIQPLPTNNDDLSAITGM
jgi:hypothetical protein